MKEENVIVISCSALYTVRRFYAIWFILQFISHEILIGMLSTG